MTEKLQVTARPDNLRPHAKGQVFDLLTTVHSAGELVWEETSTFLRGTRRRARVERYAAAKAAPAGVSGDHNPIHRRELRLLARATRAAAPRTSSAATG